MKYQSILGNCDETTVGELVTRCPDTLPIFRKYLPELTSDSGTTVKEVAKEANEEPGRLCQALFDTVMSQTSIDDLDTDTLLELITREYEANHLEQLPQVHRLARKIEAVHRDNPDLPKGITRAVKELEQTLVEHTERENDFVLNRMEGDQPPRLETPIAQMNEDHSLIKKQLRTLRKMTGAYSAPEAACRSWRRLYQELKDLDFSLSEQIHLERDILFPRFQF